MARSPVSRSCVAGALALADLVLGTPSTGGISMPAASISFEPFEGMTSAAPSPSISLLSSTSAANEAPKPTHASSCGDWTISVHTTIAGNTFHPTHLRDTGHHTMAVISELPDRPAPELSLIHVTEPTRLGMIS